MNNKAKFIEEIGKGYSFDGPSIILGGALLNGESVPDLKIRIPLRTINRHGLIAGATGTGKTKTLQIIAEGLSENGVPVLLMDVKGDLSGIAYQGKSDSKIEERHLRIGIPFQPTQYPVEFLSLSQEEGVRLRATVTEFGPILFSRILDLNETQGGIVALIFKFCDDEALPLLDLKDFKKVLQYVTNDGKSKIEEVYGNIPTSSSSTILRKIIELEQQGANMFFGEKSFDVEDLLQFSHNKGYISVLKLSDIQNKPKLFSAFMLSMLAEIYTSFPEIGDPEKPKLVIFIDEAHLIFNEATHTLLNQIETIIKLIRSKGIGVIFCTQNPSDIPASILGQLGFKIQHALRAFTANDRKMIKMVCENYPISEFYNTDELLTSLGIGEAAITVLSEKGSPSPLVATLLKAPQSRMGIITKQEALAIINSSSLVIKYNKEIDRESAFEMLTDKINLKRDSDLEDKESTKPMAGKKEKSTLEKVIQSPLARQIGRSLVQEISRGLLGVLGISSKQKRR